MEEVKCKKEADQQITMLNNPSTISHNGDTKKKHARRSNDDIYLRDEFQSINVIIKHYHFV